MAELAECLICGHVFAKTSLRDLCEKCYKKEQEKLHKVTDFLKKRSNRTAPMAQIVEETDVDIESIERFIREGKIRFSLNPNIGYKCKKCGNLIQEGNLCILCRGELTDDLKKYSNEEERQQRILKRNEEIKGIRQSTYYFKDQK